MAQEEQNPQDSDLQAGIRATMWGKILDLRLKSELWPWRSVERSSPRVQDQGSGRTGDGDREDRDGGDVRTHHGDAGSHPGIRNTNNLLFSPT